MSKLCPKASDDFIRDSLYREFKRYGDISIKVVNEPDERVAYVYFRSAEDAREVKHSKNKIYIYDRPVKVEAAYESAPQQQGGGGGGGYKQQTGGPVGDYGDKYSSNNRRYVSIVCLPSSTCCIAPSRESSDDDDVIDIFLSPSPTTVY